MWSVRNRGVSWRGVWEVGETHTTQPVHSNDATICVFDVETILQDTTQRDGNDCHVCSLGMVSYPTVSQTHQEFPIVKPVRQQRCAHLHRRAHFSIPQYQTYPEKTKMRKKQHTHPTHPATPTIRAVMRRVNVRATIANAKRAGCSLPVAPVMHND